MRASALVLLAALGAACGGPPCRDPQSARALVDARRVAIATTAAPHAELVLVRHRLDQLLADVLPSIEPVAVPVPPALRLLGIPELELVATRATIEPAAAGKVAAAIDVAIAVAPVRLPLGTVTLEATPEVVRRGDRSVLVVRFAGDAIRRLEPSSAHRAAWARSYDKLPAAIRDRLAPLQFFAAVELVARHLGNAGFALLRRHLLSRIEEVTRISVTLPDLPITRTAVRTAPDALVVELWTDLPVAAGVEPSGDPILPSGSAALRLSAEAVTEIANWAVATGRAPREHDRELRPARGGAYLPILGWRRGERRPLEIHVFRFKRPCGIIRVAARPTLETAGGELEVGVIDGVVERVEGSVAVKLGVWAGRLFRGAIEKSRSYASTTTTRVGDVILATTVTDARLDGDTLIVDIELLARPD